MNCTSNALTGCGPYSEWFPIIVIIVASIGIIALILSEWITKWRKKRNEN